jgi:hypothetical protein
VKNEPVEVFELIAEIDDELPLAFRRALEFFRVGIDHYRIRNFTEAGALFRQALEPEPSENPSKVYLAHRESYLIKPLSMESVCAEIRSPVSGLRT